MSESVNNLVQDDGKSVLSLRSILIGCFLVAGMSALAPYNDFVVENGFLIGGYLPTFLVFCLFGLVLLNAILHKIAPGSILRTSELATITLMLLAGSSIPCQGLLRTLLPTLVHPVYYAIGSEEFRKAFHSMGLPPWLFPAPMLETAQASPIVDWFYARAPIGEAIPYRPWFGPLAFWLIFFASAFLSLISAAFIMYPQWAKNERLSFPLAQVQLALIEPPQKGKALNDLFRARSFWIALIAVVVVHSINALNQHFPHGVPKIPLEYDLRTIFTEDPWRFYPDAIKTNRLMFIYIGTAFFIQARMSFSIWFIFFLFNTILVALAAQAKIEVAVGAKYDQHLGGCIVMMVGMLWVGRHYYWNVISKPLKHHPFALAGFIIGIAGMMTWLLFLQVSVWVAMLIIIMLLISHLTTARIVAETGLPIVRTDPRPIQVMNRVPTKWITTRDVFFGTLFGTNGATLGRESSAAFAQEALCVFDGTSDVARRRTKLGLLMALALVIAFVFGTWSHLKCYYTYALPISTRSGSQVINDTAARGFLNLNAEAVIEFSRGGFREPNYSPVRHLTLGIAVSSILTLMSLRFAAWPLLAVGYVLAPTWFAEQAWFSVMIGWLAKVLIVRFGGAGMFKKLRPLFMGLIVGEVLAGAIWLIVNIILASNGYDYFPVRLIPS